MITINGLYRQLVYDVERYNDTMNNDNDNDNDVNPVIGLETGSNRNCGGVSSTIRSTATVTMFQTKLI